MDYIPQFGQNTNQDQMPQDDAMMQLELQRRMKFADALRNQAAPEGQMVSGHYVAPSWTQYLANAVGKYQGGKQEQEAMKQYGEYQKSKSQKYADLLGEADNAKFQQGLAQMPEYAPDLVKSRLANITKQENPMVVPAGSTVFQGGKAVYTAPKEEALKSEYANVQQDPQTGKFFGVNIKTNQVEQIPGAAMSPKPAMTPYEKESLGLRRQELNTKHTVDQGSVDATASMIANGQVAPLSGFAMKTDWGQQVMKRVNDLNPQFSGATFGNVKQAEQKFNVGKQGDTVRSLNVATSHLDTLGTLADALNTGNIQAVNKAANIWKTQTGSSAPTNFEGAKKIVADEVVKAVVGSGGGVADREEAARSIQAANSPAQLRGVINTYKDLMHGQLNGLRQQYEQSTGKTDFERFLSPQIKTQNAPSAARSAADAILGH